MLTAFDWFIITIISFGGLVSVFLMIKMYWARRAIDFLYILVCSKCVNDMALLFITEKWDALQAMECPTKEQFQAACQKRINRFYLTPFASWNRWTFLPNLETARILYWDYHKGIITNDVNEYLLRANAFKEQLREMYEEEKD